MANALFDWGRNSFLLGDTAWVADVINVNLVDANVYNPNANLATLQFYSAASAGTVGPETLIPARTAPTNNGVGDGGDTTLASVSGAVSEQLLIWKDTGNDATSPVLISIDTATGLPVTPNTGDITITWDNGPNRIFKL